MKTLWCIPPKQSAAFVCAMEDVLDVYERPFNAQRPVIAFDEKPCQLIDHVLQPINPKPGQVKREDAEYKRCGTANIFGWVEPLTGQRDAWVTSQRTSIDYAQALERLASAYPEAEVIVLVQDNLSTHSKAAFYSAFKPEKARRLAARFEFHFTPRHGSWLNVQELEWSALARQALGERVGDRVRLEGLVDRWVLERRARQVRVDWQFRTSDARVKLKGLYPQNIG